MKGFLVLVAAVALTGGLVAGVLALLLPQVVSGITLGVLVSLLLSSVSDLSTRALDLAPLQCNADDMSLF